MENYYTFDEINLTDIKLSKTKSKSSKKFLKVYYNKNDLLIKLPQTTVEFNTKVNDYNQVEVYVNATEVADKLKEVDNFMENFAKSNKAVEDNSIYIPSLKSCDTMKLKINNDTVIFDVDNKKIDIEEQSQYCNILTKNSVVKVAIKCSCLWSIEERYGLAWSIKQIKVIEQGQEDVDFVSSSDNDSISSDWLDD